MHLSSDATIIRTVADTEKLIVKKAVAVDQALWLRCRKKAKEQKVIWAHWVQDALRAALKGGK